MSQEELALIEKAKLGDELSIKKIIDTHSGICVDTYKKYSSRPSVPGYVSQDIQTSKDYIIFKSIKTYDPSRGSKFSTWLANQTRYFCLNTINKSSKLVQVEEDCINFLIEKNGTEKPLIEKKINEEHDEQILREIKKSISNIKNKKVKECLIKKFFPEDGRNRTYTEIAKEIGVTVQTTINWSNKFINHWKNKYNKTPINKNEHVKYE